MKRRGPFLSPETIDGLDFGLRLAAQPGVQARLAAYEAALMRDRALLRPLPRERLADAIRECRIWTIPHAFETRSTEEMVEVLARVMRSKRRPMILRALGWTDDPAETTDAA